MARTRREPAKPRTPASGAPVPPRLGDAEALALFDSLKSYIGFTRQDSRLLAEFWPKVAPSMGRIVRDFYTRIERDPGTRKVMTGGAAQAERLKATLAAWLERTIRGPHDGEFVDLQAAIGVRHVQVGLDQSFMITGMHVFRDHLDRILEGTPGLASRRASAIRRSYMRVIDLSLALMLQTYQADWLKKILRTEQNATFRRLAAIGEVSAVIAHEIKNPLAAISGAVQVFEQELAPEDRRRAILKEVRDEILRLDGKVNELLTYARPTVPALELVDPEAFLRGMVRLLSGDPLIGSVKLVVKVEKRLPAFPMDVAQMRQVLMNLILNALHALEGRGTVRLTARKIPEGGIEIGVEDDGPGIRSEIREEIFRPFFSTRTRGTGLGLPISRKIVESHGGSLTLDLTPRKGARFVVTLHIPPAVSAYPQVR